MTFPLKSPNPAAKYRAVFRCISGCPGDYPLNEIIYQCPKCQDLLEVVHDLDPLRMTPPEEWRDVFDSRFMRTFWPYGSGVWGKKEFVCPDVLDENIVSTCEGGSNLFWAEQLGYRWGLKDLWIKQCGNSHSGSFKDLGMTVLVSMVKQMRHEGKNIPAVACASTGDTSASLAAYCATAGIPAIVFLPKNKVSSAQLVQPLAHGAITLAIDTDFDGCMQIVKEITGRNNIYLANSMNSLRIEGQKTISFELCQQFDWEVPDLIVIPGGNLGNVSALGQGFLLMKAVGLIDRMPRIVCAQAENANPLYLSYLKSFNEFDSVPAKPTLASAIQIGNPVSVKKAIRVLKRFNGTVEQASEAELAEAAAEGDLTGLYNCPHTGVALAALKKIIRRGEVRPDERIVVISTAHGLKFTSFKTRYHTSEYKDIECRFANPPIEVHATYDAVRNALFRSLDARNAQISKA
ncbi:MAG: threonine synthase [Acidobacteria bacterium]|nr:threonine synthase [Acidobacteriota bacterium]